MTLALPVKLSDFNYILPQELIASRPLEDRPAAKLMVCSRSDGHLTHSVFRDLEQLLRTGDVLVLNNTKVLPARLFGRRESGGRLEALLLEEHEERIWSVLLNPSGRIKKDARLSFGETGDGLHAKVLDGPQPGSGRRLLRFDEKAQIKLPRIGHMPLPPYLHREATDQDRSDYQTVFAEHEGAIAAPTAGLHFDDALLNRLQQKGVEILYVTLHVGYGTFQPVTEEQLQTGELFEERFEVSGQTAERIEAAKKEGRRVIACGTTTVRALESASDSEGRLHGGPSRTKLLIKPPYKFRIIDGLITNFHLPESSLLMLVGAFYGIENVRKAYEAAVSQRYRFYSYGDAMVIL